LIKRSLNNESFGPNSNITNATSDRIYQIQKTTTKELPRNNQRNNDHITNEMHSSQKVQLFVLKKRTSEHHSSQLAVIIEY